MRKMILLAVLASLSFAATAQHSATSPIGKWKTLDDKTGKVMTISEVYEAKNGTLAAKIVEAVGVPATCTTCSGQHKDKPMVGIVTLWNLKANKDGTWGGGNGYKPVGRPQLHRQVGHAGGRRQEARSERLRGLHLPHRYLGTGGLTLPRAPSGRLPPGPFPVRCARWWRTSFAGLLLALAAAATRAGSPAGALEDHR